MPSGSPQGRRPRHRVRRVVNLVTLATPAGLLLARLRGIRPEPGAHGLVLVPGHPRAFPLARNVALTVGDVVLTRLSIPELHRRPELLRHEARHARQWAACLGPVGFLPLYGLASLWSWLRTGHPAWANVFEQAAGLSDGGYRPGHRRALLGPTAAGPRPGSPDP